MRISYQYLLLQPCPGAIGAAGSDPRDLPPLLCGLMCLKEGDAVQW
jgi:hypothetical protein